MIQCRANQKRDVSGLIRVDKKFRTYRPDDQKEEYHKRPRIEAVLPLSEDIVQSNRQQSERLRQRSFIRALQHPLLGSELRSSREHGEIR